MGWLQLIVQAVGLLPNAGFLIEMISAAIDDCIALSHGAIAVSYTHLRAHET